MQNKSNERDNPSLPFLTVIVPQSDHGVCKYINEDLGENTVEENVVEDFRIENLDYYEALFLKLIRKDISDSLQEQFDYALPDGLSFEGFVFSNDGYCYYQFVKISGTMLLLKELRKLLWQFDENNKNKYSERAGLWTSGDFIYYPLDETDISSPQELPFELFDDDSADGLDGCDWVFLVKDYKKQLNDLGIYQISWPPLIETLSQNGEQKEYPLEGKPYAKYQFDKAPDIRVTWYNKYNSRIYERSEGSSEGLFCKWYFSDGSLKCLNKYENNKYNKGTLISQKEYFKTGVLRAVRNYDVSLEFETEDYFTSNVEYFKNGIKKSEEIWNEKVEADFQHFFKNGKLKKKGKFTLHLGFKYRFGLWSFYNKEGNMKKSVEYDDENFQVIKVNRM